MIAVHKILCPIDFSETSKHALAFAGLFARQFGAELVVLHAVENVPLLTAYTGIPQVGLLSEVERSARKELAELVGGLEAVSARAEVARGTAYKTILRYAEELAADMIVMGTHGRSGLDYAFFGSVTERVIRRAPCPVLIVRSPESLQGPQAARK